MTQSAQKTGITVEAGLTPEGEALAEGMFEDPHFLMLAGLGLGAYIIGRWVIGPRDPSKPRKWWDYRRID